MSPSLDGRRSAFTVSALRMKWSSSARGLYALALAVLFSGSASGAPIQAPAFDGSGTTRIDGGEELEVGGAMVRAHIGGGTVEGPGFDRMLGATALMRVFAPIELGFGLPDVRHHPGAYDGPVVDPGDLVLVARTASLPYLSGVALSAALSTPPAPLPDSSRRPRIEGRLALGRDLGPLRPLFNAGLLASLTAPVEPWLGGGLTVDLPAGTALSGDVQAIIGQPVRYGASFGVPAGAGVLVVVDGWRQVLREEPAGYEVTVNLVMLADSLGPGLGQRLDRDEDGVADADDSCPSRWGELANGCPSPVFAFAACDCPLSDLSVFELERLVMALSTTPQGEMYIITLTLEPSGDVMTDWEATMAAVAGARRALIKSGVPGGNFEIVGRDPAQGVDGIPVSIRTMSGWKVDDYMKSNGWVEPDLGEPLNTLEQKRPSEELLDDGEPPVEAGDDLP